MNGILDLDSIAAWHHDSSSLVYAENIWSQVEAKQKRKKADWLFTALTYAEDRLDDDLEKYLRRNAEEILITRHNSVTAYHGFRPRDHSSYYKHGILCSNQETLIQEAKDIFQGPPGGDRAIQDIGPEYFDHDSGKVYLYYSAYAAKQGGEGHVKGSESIRCIAQRLGQQAELQYALTGKPTLIKCAIPIDWIRENKSA